MFLNQLFNYKWSSHITGLTTFLAPTVHGRLAWRTKNKAADQNPRLWLHWRKYYSYKSRNKRVKFTTAVFAIVSPPLGFWSVSQSDAFVISRPKDCVFCIHLNSILYSEHIPKIVFNKCKQAFDTYINYLSVLCVALIDGLNCLIKLSLSASASYGLVARLRLLILNRLWYYYRFEGGDRGKPKQLYKGAMLLAIAVNRSMIYLRRREFKIEVFQVI